VIFRVNKLGINTVAITNPEMAGQDFACAADAITAAEKLSTKMKWHKLDHIQTVEKPHYAKRGKPQPDAIPTGIIAVFILP